MKTQAEIDQNFLQQAIEITEKVVNHLQQNELEAVQALYQKRQELLEKVFASGKITHEKLTRKLLSLNDQVVEILQTQQQAVLVQQKKTNHANHATKAYQNHS